MLSQNTENVEKQYYTLNWYVTSVVLRDIEMHAQIKHLR